MLTIDAFLAQVPGDSIDKDYYQQKILKYRTACGCASGAAFFLIAMVGYVLFLVYSVRPLEGYLIELSLYGVLIVFIAGFVGKVLGLFVARLKLYILYKILIHKYK